MIQVHTNPGQLSDKVYYDFSDEERIRIQEICEELKEIFMADSVGLRIDRDSYGGPIDWCIDISSCPNLTNWVNVYKV